MANTHNARDRADWRTWRGAGDARGRCTLRGPDEPMAPGVAALGLCSRVAGGNPRKYTGTAMRWVFATLLLVLFPCKAMAQSDAEKISRAVNTCIDFVRSLPGEYRGQFVSFDAYVDPATGGVKYYGTPSAGFQFAKCLVGIERFMDVPSALYGAPPGPPVESYEPPHHHEGGPPHHFRPPHHHWGGPPHHFRRPPMRHFGGGWGPPMPMGPPATGPKDTPIGPLGPGPRSNMQMHPNWYEGPPGW